MWRLQVAVGGVFQLVISLSSLPSLYSLCGSLAGITHRCAQMLEALEELQVRCSDGDAAALTCCVADVPWFCVGIGVVASLTACLRAS